jgi:hypothetical protein
MGDSEDMIETDDEWLDDFQGEEEFAWKENYMIHLAIDLSFASAITCCLYFVFCAIGDLYNSL